MVKVPPLTVPLPCAVMWVERRRARVFFVSGMVFIVKKTPAHGGGKFKGGIMQQFYMRQNPSTDFSFSQNPFLGGGAEPACVCAIAVSIAEGGGVLPSSELYGNSSKE